MKKLLFIAFAAVLSCGSPSTSEPGPKMDSVVLVSPGDTSGSNPAGESVPEGADSSFLGKKRGMGIDFYAIGQEPGWSLDMDTAKIYRFRTMEGHEINTPPVAGTISNDGKVISYYASVEMGKMYITITKEPCTDVMSGEPFSCRVQVRVKRGIDKDFKTYNGCGRFL